MRAYLDTNVLVAAMVEGHSYHVTAYDLLTDVKRGVLQDSISTHGLAECYSVLTRTPFTPRIHPIIANRFLEESVYPYVEAVAFSEAGYRTVLANLANAGHAGGAIFDVLHLWEALKANCDRIYTFNVKHFRMLASEEQARKITAS